MVRLIQKEESGKWQVNGIPWEKLQKGEVITEDVSQSLFGCLCKLKDYEDTDGIRSGYRTGCMSWKTWLAMYVMICAGIDTIYVRIRTG